jgi:hypothetical protein
MLDLFGVEITEEEYLSNPAPKPHESDYQKFKRVNNYRKAIIPDERCACCTSHLSGVYHNKIYHKCSLIGLSHSEATDIRVNHVCNCFEKESISEDLFNSKGGKSE